MAYRNPKAQLVVAACLFLGWLGYLGCLVYQSRDQVILSRPQFLIAQVYVVIDVRDDGGKANPDAAVTQVLWAAVKEDEGLTKVHLLDLSDLDKEHGYRGTGKYLVPLVKSRVTPFLIAPIPQGAHETRIYRWTPDAQAQVSRLIAAKS